MRRGQWVYMAGVSFTKALLRALKKSNKELKEAKNNSNSKTYERASTPLVNKTDVEKPSDEKLDRSK